MCGICGIFNFTKPLAEPEIIKNMADVLVHRGPDGEGFYINSFSMPFFVGDSKVQRTDGIGNVVLGHRRLSIIDLDGGHQPLTNEDGTLWVTYNGEIYNFLEIQDFLKSKGHVFRTNCDTEVIVHGYEEWGSDCVCKFRGMFAFAIWDTTNNSLFLARDRVGIKPLYYYIDSDKFIFASELKGILAAGDVAKDINHQAFFDYLNALPQIQ